MNNKQIEAEKRLFKNTTDEERCPKNEKIIVKERYSSTRVKSLNTKSRGSQILMNM
jgi:hypothetical protein